MCEITKENDSLQRQTENKDEDSQKIQCNKNIPELRFPEFEGEWEDNKIDYFFKISVAGDLKKEELSKFKINEFKYPVYGNALEKKGLLGYYENYKYEENNITVTARGNLGVALLRKKPFNAVGRLIILIPKTELNSYYVTQYINSKFKIYVESTGVPQLTAPSFRLNKIKIPKLNEQNKIANFLSAIDKKIELMEKKHTLYKNIKKYFLDNLFPHEKRDIPDLSFKEYSNIWKQIKLKQIIYKAKAGGTPKSSIKEYYNGNIPFLSINDMTNEGKYITYTEKSITEKGLKNSSAWLVPEKSLLYSMYASVGFVSINNIPLTTSQAIFNIIFKEQVSLEFMYYYLTFYKRYIHKYIETGTQGNLNAKLIKNFKIKIPSKEEQRKIADFLSLIDTYIEINKEKLNHLKQFKKGLLQKMFC